MRRRLDLAMTLVGGPRVIFLDEPTTGLDPRSRRTMWEIIRELVAGGVTIFLTTQYLDEADQLADRIGVLDHGRLVAEGTPAELKRASPADTSGSFRRRDAVAGGRRVRRGDRRDDELTLQVPSGRRRSRRCGLLDRLDGRASTPVGRDPRPRRRVPRADRHAPTERKRWHRCDDPLAYALRDSARCSGAISAHARYPSLTIFLVGIPVLLLLLFVYVFGGTLGAGLGGAGPGRPRGYIAFVVPGILLSPSPARLGTAISVAMDMTAGIIARFRTMDIARVSVLTGHVVGSVIQTCSPWSSCSASPSCRLPPNAGPIGWLAAVGLLGLAALAYLAVGRPGPGRQASRRPATRPCS